MQPTDSNELTAPAAIAPKPVWQRLAVAGFWFFLLKGLLWLAAPLAWWLWP